MLDPLSRLAIQHGTDKYGYHDYTPNYFDLFKHLRDKPLRLLEIGVGGYGNEDRGGESLAVWRDFFPNARIIGIDIQKKTLDLGERVRILQGSQVDAEFLEDLVAEEGPFDIIIDDGSHRNEHVVESFHLLYPTLKSGGIYVVEDTQTAFFPRFGGSLGLVQPNSIGLFTSYFSAMLGYSSEGILMPTDITMIERFHNIVALHKAPSATIPTWFNEIEDNGGNVVRISQTDSLQISTNDFEDRFDALNENSALHLQLSAEDKFIDQEFIKFIGQRFVEIDHREMSINFPDYSAHSFATKLRALAVSRDGIFVHCAPNDHPSNFEYDIANPQAREALENMAAVLAEGGSENGILQYTEMMTRFGKPEIAAQFLEGLQERAPQSRRYYESALVAARRNRNMKEIGSLLEAAVKAHPNDATFVAELAGQKLRNRQIDTALDLLEPALQENPRARVLHSQLSNAQAAKGQFEEALESLNTAIKLSPQPARPQMELGLAKIHMQAKDYDKAESVIQGALETNPKLDRAYRLQSEICLLQNDTDGARYAIEMALELSPDNPAYLKWLDRVNKAR